VHLNRHWCGLAFYDIATAKTEATPLQRRPAQRLGYLRLKRLADIVISLIAIIVCLPTLGLISVVIFLDSGAPIFFTQRRGGAAGRTFSILKFRTLITSEDGPEVAQVHKHDPRVTRVGRFLRTFHLDELPQLFNVLGGDMSLVGPRPHAISHDAYYGSRIPDYEHRYAVKPGITGWAQINGSRGPTPLLSDMQARIELDLWYVENATLVMDLLILIKTPFAVARKRPEVPNLAAMNVRHPDLPSMPKIEPHTRAAEQLCPKPGRRA
jgi:putative colanic acid biosynthesis UDP-glucose lipid carrier transferase